MNRRMIVDWKGLKELGWPYSRAHTQRLMQKEIELSRCIDRETKEREYWTIPNPDPFPQSHSLGHFKFSPKVWIMDEVLDYFRRHGLMIDAD